MRRVLVDADAFATLALVGRPTLLRGIDGRVEMPAVVQVEVAEGPAAGALERALAGEPQWVRTSPNPAVADVEHAAEMLGHEESPRSFEGDVELLAPALGAEDSVVVTDDRPLRTACRRLGLAVSGSIGVVVAAVERGDLAPNEAREVLVAMDEVGPRLTVRTLDAAERLIDEAAGSRGG